MIPLRKEDPTPLIPLDNKASDATIEVRGVNKCFYIYEHRPTSIRELFVQALKSSNGKAKQPHFTLRDVSLSIHPGETWALIGPNGAGKSTLLRLIAGIYWPTSGLVITRGRLAALIELTAGFHPELTGQENVFLYGSLLGHSRRELSRLYTEIVEFAGLEEFMDTPVKYYSTGMRMRLGFSVATSVRPDVLILDEALAIGDAGFNERCTERIRSFQDSGCTLVIATHDLAMAESLANQAAWIDQGRVQRQGPIHDVIAAYKASFHR